MLYVDFTLDLIKYCACRSGRYEVDGYVYNSAEEPKILMTGKWNESMSYQPCDSEGEPLPGTELKEVRFYQLHLVTCRILFRKTWSGLLYGSCKVELQVQT